MFLKRVVVIAGAVMCAVVLGAPFVSFAGAPERIPTQKILATTPEYDKTRYEMALLIRDSLRKLGLDIEVQPMDLKVLVNTIRTEPWNYDGYVKGWGGTTDRVDPHNFLYNVVASKEIRNLGMNRQGHSDGKYDEAVERAEKFMDPEKRRDALFVVQKMLVDDVGFFPVYYEDQYQAYNSDRIEGVVVQGGLGIDNYLTYVDAKVKKGPNTLFVAQRQSNDLLNPMSSVLFTDRKILNLIYDTLARLDADDKPFPCAAESWKVLDDKTVQVVLRANLKFHDGHPLTADDVAFTFNYGRKWGFGKLDSYIKPIETVEVVDDRTVVFHLKEPTGFLVTGTFVSVPILPRHIWEPITEGGKIKSPHDWACPEPVGSGPFKFSYWRRGEEIRLDRFEDYHRKANVDAVILMPFSNPDAILGALEEGVVDFYGEELKPLQIDQARTMKNLTVTDTVGIGFAMFGYNQRRAPWSDVAFRRAMAHAVDINTIVDVVAAGYVTPAGAGRVISPANKFWNNPDLPSYDYDVDKAKGILKDAGYSWDKDGMLCFPEK